MGLNVTSLDDRVTVESLPTFGVADLLVSVVLTVAVVRNRSFFDFFVVVG